MRYLPEGWPWEAPDLDYKIGTKYTVYGAWGPDSGFGGWARPGAETEPELGIRIAELHRHWLICATCGNEIEPCRDLNCDHESDHIERRWKQMPNMVVAELLRNCLLCAHDRLIISLARKLGRV